MKQLVYNDAIESGEEDSTEFSKSILDAASSTTVRFNSFLCNDDDDDEWDSLVKNLFESNTMSNHSSTAFMTSHDETNLPTATLMRRIQQLESWDCGIACLLMVFDWAYDNNALSRDELVREIATKSVWTIDLVWLLQEQIQRKHLPLKYLFSSQTLQVNVNHHDFDYYKSSFHSDMERVNHLFRRIKSEQLLAVQQARLSMRRFIHLIKQPNCVAIALVDNSILMGPHYKTGMTKQYTGHYILILGVSRDTSSLDTIHDICLVIENPGMAASHLDCHLLSLEHFEKAWRAPGTDEDVVFIVKQQHC
ncbi:hypothetical protein MPSEU_000223300 [Mayamaea pseudoterrestris]|nr:hypothetical protein MPSEU_000223300 [Mayamaea pseudoterrestris]